MIVYLARAESGPAPLPGRRAACQAAGLAARARSSWNSCRSGCITACSSIGAVPPGLRKPSDIAASVVYRPGGGTAPPNAGLVLLGIGVEVAVVEGGYALLTKESLEAADDWRTNHAQPVERFLAMDIWTMEATKALAESLQVTESWDVDLIPGVVEFDELDLGEAWALDATKQIDESLQVVEGWDLVLNP